MRIVLTSRSLAVESAQKSKPVPMHRLYIWTHDDFIVDAEKRRRAIKRASMGHNITLRDAKTTSSVLLD